MRLISLLLLSLAFLGTLPLLNAQSSDEESKKYRDDRQRFAIGFSTASEGVFDSFYGFTDFVRLNSRVSLRYAPALDHSLIFSFNPFRESFSGSFPTIRENMPSGSVNLRQKNIDFSLAYLYNLGLAASDWDLFIGVQIETTVLNFKPVDSYDPELDGDLPLGTSAFVWNFDALVGVRYTIPRLPLEIDLRVGPSLQETLWLDQTRERAVQLAPPRLGVRYTFGGQL